MRICLYPRTGFPQYGHTEDMNNHICFCQAEYGIKRANSHQKVYPNPLSVFISDSTPEMEQRNLYVSPSEAGD